ncbi:hypothetical protein ALC60_03737 [Trachymyrmex zeteki]|uniref:Helix-turn-helix domain-containing protein n=1 Tax=Mycetomoellerius zeteki TaxID=64791 RepID=A0A151XAA8_9HYME|nr:hypothetical protein ALC60_03737 [Trachymyrmex zeteki]
MEVCKDRKISFLDTLVIVEEQSLIFYLYRKATFSGRFLNFNSYYPLCHKRGVIYGLVDKIIRICHPRFQQNNLINVINILLNNGYPLEFVFSAIHKRIKFHINKSGTVEKKIKEKFFMIPYVNSVSEKFTPIANRFHCKLAFSIPNSLRKFIGKGKDQLDHLCNQNVVHKISCNDCDANYVGQMKRQLKTRLHEHVSDINKRSKSPTVITNHRIDQNHNFDWDNVEILDREASYNKRLISEMVHIKRQTHGINKQNDTDSLPESYLNIIQSLSPS